MNTMTQRHDLRRIYEALFAMYGPQHWWPGESPFEIMVGAILTQNTAWSHVARAIRRLGQENHLTPLAIVSADPACLAAWLRPTGYFNVKAQRLQDFCRWYLAHGQATALATVPTADLRRALLAVNGIGPETADDILLYALERPVFVVDAYTRRLLARLAVAQGNEPYETLRALFEGALGAEVALYNEYHALIVRHAQDTCHKRQPLSHQCGLVQHCPAAAL